MIQQYIREPNEQRYLPTNPNVQRLNIRKLQFFRKALSSTNLRINILLCGSSHYRQLNKSPPLLYGKFVRLQNLILLCRFIKKVYGILSPPPFFSEFSG